MSLTCCVVVTWGGVWKSAVIAFLLPACQQWKPSISGKLQSISARLIKSQAVGVLYFVLFLPKLSWEQSSKQNPTCYWRLHVGAQRCSALSSELRQFVRRSCSRLQASSEHTYWSCVVIPGQGIRFMPTLSCMSSLELFEDEWDSRSCQSWAPGLRLGSGRCGEKGREDCNGIFPPSYQAGLPRSSESRTARISCESLLLLLLTLRLLAISPMAADAVLISLAQSCGPAGISSKESTGLGCQARGPTCNHPAVSTLWLHSMGNQSFMAEKSTNFLFPLRLQIQLHFFPESEPRRWRTLAEMMILPIDHK